MLENLDLYQITNLQMEINHMLEPAPPGHHQHPQPLQVQSEAEDLGDEECGSKPLVYVALFH